MLFTFLVLLFVYADDIINQSDTWKALTYNMPTLSNNEDLIIYLTKPEDSSSLLFLLGYILPPEFEYNKSKDEWTNAYKEADFEGWVNNNDVLVLRLEYALAKSITEVYLGIYKDDSEIVEYTIAFSSVPSTKCEEECVHGECSQGSCSCSGTTYGGRYCGQIIGQLKNIDQMYAFEVPSSSWRFYLLPDTSEREINCEIDQVKTGMKIFQMQSSKSNLLPSMLSYDFMYLKNSNEHSTLTITLLNKKYRMWALYCFSDKSCELNLRFYVTSSNSMNFLWIIVASIISLALICIATPIILKIVFKYRERNAARVAISIVEEKQNKLRKLYPDEKFQESPEKNTCTICLEDFKNGSVTRKLSCLHIFHTNCIDEWCANHDNCPNCKKDMFSVDNMEISQLD